MKKNKYKILCSVFSVFTAVTLLLTTFYSVIVWADDETSVWFSEDYSTYSTSILKDRGWSFNNVSVDFPSDALRIKTSGGNMSLTGKTEYLSWSDYTVSCKMTVTDQSATGIWDGSKFYAGLSFALNSSGNGYEFCLTSADKGKTFYARLYNRASRKVCCAETAVSDVKLNGQVTLKAVLKEKTVECYLNSVKIFEYSATSVLKGTIGYRGSTSMTIFDDLTVVGAKIEDNNNPEKDVPDKTVIISQDFNSGTPQSIFTANNGFGTTNLSDSEIQDGKLLTNSAFSAYSNEKICSGSISADICFPKEPEVLKQATSAKTVYNGCLSARKTGSSQEVRARFSLKYTPSTKVYDVSVQSVYYDAVDIGASPKVYTYKIDDFEFGKTYNLKLLLVGNYVGIFLDGKAVEEGAFKDGNSLTTQCGSYGIFSVANSGSVLYDNVEIIRYHAYSLNIAESKNGKISADTFFDPAFTTQNTQRKYFYSGEEVKLYSSPDDGMVLSTLSYGNETDKTAITSKTGENIYAFLMPSADTTVFSEFAEGIAEPITVCVDDSFDSSKISSSAGWGNTAGSYSIEKGKLVTEKSFSVNSAKSIIDGKISADIAIEEPSDALKNATEVTKVYTGNLSARNTKDKHEIRSRFTVKYTPDTEKYSSTLDLVVYDNTDYGSAAKTFSYPLTDFEFGKVYHVELECIGNYILVSLDGISVFEKCLSYGNALNERVGNFGISATGNSAKVSFDNVKIVNYKTFNASLEDSASQYMSLEQYENPESSELPLNARNEFYVGELVKVKIASQSNIDIDKSKFYYTENGDKRLITAFDSDVLCGFFMPYSETVVSGEFVKNTGNKNDIWYSDDFDSESLMLERGWNKDALIKNGEMVLDTGNISKVLLNGLDYAFKWQNYMVEGDVTLQTAEGDGSLACIALMLRCNSSSVGYEFGILVPSGKKSGYFRLYDRAKGEIIAYTSSGTAKIGQKYHLTVMASGKTIDCFVDDKLVFTVTNADSSAVGTIGATVAKGMGTVDNITVRKIDSTYPGKSSAKDKNDKDNKYNNDQISPLTGSNKFVIYGYLLSAVLLGISVCFGIFAFIRNRGTEYDKR